MTKSQESSPNNFMVSNSQTFLAKCLFFQVQIYAKSKFIHLLFFSRDKNVFQMELGLWDLGPGVMRLMQTLPLGSV